MTTRLGPIVKYSTLRQINREAITQSGLNEIFRGVGWTLKKIVPYDRIALSLYAPEYEALQLTFAEGQGDESFYQAGLLLHSQSSHHGWVFRSQKPLLKRDLTRELEFRIEQPNIEEGIRSYCAVPLIAQRQSVGVLIVLSCGRNRYSQADAEFLQEVSDQLVLAVKSMMPTCQKHLGSKLFCPRCIGSGGGRTTATKYRSNLPDWGKQGGRGRQKRLNTLTNTLGAPGKNKD
jgi:signal transduction protein with GAF and PtsI domain